MKSTVLQLNSQFDCLINKLIQYIQEVNQNIKLESKLDFTKRNLQDLFGYSVDFSIKYLNFNYTETLQVLEYADENDIIYIHGRVARSETNPLIFGYGDESDPVYQSIEDSGENAYLEHIKSFGYFKTPNYRNLLSYIDSADFDVSIVGHSCGLSDRVLLNEIFEHENCKSIDTFYHSIDDKTDYFKQITQEISRHFKPQNKNLMRRKVKDKNPENTIPQNRNV